MCNSRMPRTNYHLHTDNEVEQRFWGKVEIERATSYFFYTKGSDYRHILFKLKYHGYKELGEVMGRYMAKELLTSDFLQGIDLIVPVPLHSKKKKTINCYSSTKTSGESSKRDFITTMKTKKLS